MFESYVILDTTKTVKDLATAAVGFESYVILDTTKTRVSQSARGCLFESYVILDTTKTIFLATLHITGLRVMLF